MRHHARLPRPSRVAAHEEKRGPGARRRKPELGKYLLYVHFAKDTFIRKFLPPTRRYRHETVRSFLNQYGVVYLKPQGGSRGRGIMKVWRRDGAVYVQHTVYAPKRFASVDEALTYIDQKRGGQGYVVQRGIALAKVHGRPFDIRVMMQKDVPGGQWLYAGMVAKVAGKGSAVTNVALSRGAVMRVEEALKQGLGWNAVSIRRCKNQMIQLAKRAAKHFDTYQPYREIGFDMAVDTNGRIWLLEENTAPSHPLFAKLKADLSMYRRIQFRWGRYQRALRAKRSG
ncbi:YheC/YheD family protein [Alicyclobacillus cycloheptanicus]|uniref:YheC/D like ATP-grasp n=1 Tax=Alicyclobacillus cycloheptanicus TaxID=1457 RepID=A0ABT9XED6_9BACL|nr:YheC/YheD family protein [Alicyclobacillus cycloheptanicus]MDQ0188666.1 hypothetical protein [Alicyclobacillus cycloheptanicus]WDM00661.1 YheC/YheD family protein [Alicyclobacillus cycloheptanicus]